MCVFVCVRRVKTWEESGWKKASSKSEERLFQREEFCLAEGLTESLGWLLLVTKPLLHPASCFLGQCHTSSTSMAQATVNNQWIIQWIIWTSEGVWAFRPRLCCLIPALLLIFLCGLDHIPQHFCLISFSNRSRWYLPEGLIGNLLLTESSLRSCSVILCTESDQTTLLPTKYLEI